MLVVLGLHADEDNQLQTLKKSVTALRGIQTSIRLGLILFLLSVVSRLPCLARGAVWRRLAKAAFLCFTNVTGSRGHMLFGGVDISSLHFFAPSDGRA